MQPVESSLREGSEAVDIGPMAEDASEAEIEDDLRAEGSLSSSNGVDLATKESANGFAENWYVSSDGGNGMSGCNVPNAVSRSGVGSTRLTDEKVSVLARV